MSKVGLLRLAVIVLAVGLLELCCRIGLIDKHVVIPPSEMADALVRLLIVGQFNDQILRSFFIIIVATLISVVLGFAIGTVIHALPRVREALDPFFATYYAVPIFIFYPVMIVIFGLSVMPIVLMGVATAIVAMIIATLNGLDRIPRVLTKVARVHHMGTLATALQLKLPAAAPHLFTGVKLAVSYSFIGVIASELLLAPAGIGRVISDAYSDFNNRSMYAMMLLLVVVATIVNMVLHVFDQRWAERRGIGRL
jgi:NitT/TauT family transport system permease protein